MSYYCRYDMESHLSERDFTLVRKIVAPEYSKKDCEEKGCWFHADYEIKPTQSTEKEPDAERRTD